MTVSRLATLLIFATTLGALAFITTPALATGDANEGTCPAQTEASPGFRTYLPDCRAYEQVTPTFKDGSEMELEGISEDGSHVIGRVLGTFAGLQNNTTLSGGTYELVRGPSGWTVQAISPPSSSFPVQSYEAAGSDVSRTLWITRTPSESIAAENIYIREANGTMVRVGPLIPPGASAGPPAGELAEFFLFGGQAEYQDASADLSHVFFTIERGEEHGISWPGDETNGLSSLYEYSGTGGTNPELVGVNDQGHQISTCGTWLGSNSSSDVYNAVSASGSTVFFTAVAETGGCTGPPVDELYARLDQHETIPISEPTTGAAGACIACDDSEPKPAEFAGASEDGSKVFFITEQGLLSGAGPGLNLYEYDFASAPGARVRRVSVGSTPAEVQGVARVSEDGSHVYFVARGRLGEGPRGDTEHEGREGPCLAELDPAEKAEEAEAQAQETKSESVTHGARCRPTQGAENLYVYERDAAHPGGRVSFIATLSESDERDWEASDLRRVQATSDGRFFVFQSVADLTEGDTSQVAQTFEYDAETGELVQVSKQRAGYTPTEATLDASENQSEVPVQGYFAKTAPTAANKVTISSDGSTVVFLDRAALTPEAEVAAKAGVESAYEYRSSVASGGSIGAGTAYLVSGRGTAPTRTVEGMDQSGQDVFFRTAASLVPQDTDSQLDTYDGRSDGGFLATDPPAGCDAEACFSSLYVPPPVQAPGSESISTTSPAPSVTSLPPVVMTPKAMAVKCKRGFIKKKNKCARDRSKKKTAKRDGNDRGAES